MAEEVTQNQREEEVEAPPEQESPKASGKFASWRRFLTRKWVAILVVASIVVHGVGFAYFQLADKSPEAARSCEVSLGAFGFEAGRSEVGRITNAEFSLHIALLDQVESAARRRLEDHRFRVQQDIEELLRHAHSGDFDDPNLGELKRQLQERINETLKMRAIADVIITGLKLKHRDGDLGLATDTAESVPWVEKPSG